MGGVWPRRRGAQLLAVALGLLAASPAVAGAAPATTRCTRSPFDDSRCLHLSVPLDRSGALPGTVRLLVRIEPAQSGAAAGTILALAGGPGQAAVPLFGRFMAVLPKSVLLTHQLVTFDQRGTGSSDPLSCAASGRSGSGAVTLATFDPESPLQQAVGWCAARLGPSRAHYTTADSVADIESVRAALGVDKLTLWGTSYGTKVALDYAAAYPQHVERLLLDSVVPPTGVDPFERLTIGSMPRVMRLICAGRCHTFTRDPAADLDSLVQRLARGPLAGRWVDPFGRPEPEQVTQRALFSLLLAGDFSPVLRGLLPAAVNAADAGDPALLLRLAVDAHAASSVPGINSAVLLATRCEDGSVPWAFGTPIAARSDAIDAALAGVPASQLAPFGAAGVRALGQADLCRAWPESPIPQPHAPLPDVPTLILSGALDLRTPRANALALAAQIPGAQVVNVPQTGHSTLSSDHGGCARAAVAAFFAGEQPAVCPVHMLSLFDRPVDIPPRSLQELRPLDGLPASAGRDLAAVRETLTLLLRTLFVDLPATSPTISDTGTSMAIGGLRGGAVVFADGGGVYLKNYSVVPGVMLTGRIDGGSQRKAVPAFVRLGGPAGARGWLRLGDSWTTGVLNGRRVRVRSRRIQPLSAAAARTSSGPGVPASAPLPSVPAHLRGLLRLPLG